MFGLTTTFQLPRAPHGDAEDAPAPAVAPAVVAPVVDFGKVRALVEPLVTAHLLALVDIEWATSPSGRVLRVVIERPGVAAGPDGQAGVTLEDCVNVSRDLSTALDAVDFIPMAYNLEVSSPGLDRPLKSEVDFVRHVGRLAKMKLAKPAVDGQVVLRGTILGVEGGTISIEVDGKTHAVPFADVRQARLVFELEKGVKRGQPKPSRSKKARPKKRGKKGSR
jgi:ribosome maturation factor RimP